MIVPVVAGTVTPGVKMKTGETDDPTPLDMMAMEPKKAAATIAGAARCWVPRSAEVANKNTPWLAAADPKVKPDSVTVTAAVPVGAAPIVRMSSVVEEAAFVPVIPETLDAVPPKEGVPVK